MPKFYIITIMKNLFFPFLILATVLLVFSCGNHDHSTDYEYHVHILSPNADDKNVDETLNIEVEFESLSGETVHHIQVRIYNKATNAEIYKKPSDAHIHEESGMYTFEDTFVLSAANGVSANTDWVLEASVWGHEDGEGGVMEMVEFHVHE
jgi:hypothetical protein